MAKPTLSPSVNLTVRAIVASQCLFIGCLVAVAMAALFVDIFTKQWVQHSIPLGQYVSLWPKWLHLTHTRNTGMAFSLLNDSPMLVRWGSAIMWAMLTGWLICQPKGSPLRSPLGTLAAGLVVGGALANGLERFAYGWVTDFIDVVAIHFAIFNVADVAVCIGVVLWCVLLFKHNSSATNATPKVA